jgi:uncharacterized glyoxalase superfamily protein PhnB
MAVNYMPEGYHSVTPYIIAKDAEGLIRFVEQVFAAPVIERMDNPDGTIMHAEVRVGDSPVMLSQASDQNPAQPTMLYVYVADVDEAYARGLAAGGTEIQAPKNQFYGDRSGGFADPSGNKWWVATHFEDVGKDEMDRRKTELKLKLQTAE